MDLSSKNYITTTSQGSMSGSKLAMIYTSGNRQGYSSPTYESSPNFRGQNDTSFPYGLSGVAMPNYGYPGELYQFTSNGYPRKSRTCSYCGKVFTRSTTRRYHEKRCPLLRAAVCSLIPEEKKLQGTQISRNGHSQGQSSVSSSVLSRGNLDNSTLNSGIDKLTSQPVTSLSSQSNNLTTSTQQITSPYLDNSRVDDSISSVIKPHETSFTDQDVIATSSSVHGHDLTPTRLTPDSQGSPHDQKSVDARSFSLSPFQMPAGLDLRQSPSRGKEDGHLLLSDDGNRGEFKVENGNTLDLGGQESEMFPEDIDNDGAGNNDLNFTSPVGQDTSFMDIANTIPTSMSLSQENVTESTNVNDEKDTDLGVQSNNISNDASNVSSKSCGVCGKSFESSWQLHVHEQIHKKFKPYACRFCGQRFSKAALRITHERSHVGDSNHICAVCGTSFPKKESLRIHMKKNHQEGPWLCRHCGKAMLTQTELCEHLETHDLPANEKESLQYMTSSPLGPLSEGESSYGEGDIGEMNDSEILSDSNESPEQESPGENLAIKEDENNTLEMELCTICGRDFPKAHMPYHLKAHDGQKPYECPICGKRFGYKNNMKSHIKLHAGIKPYQCNVCGAKFTRGSTLRRHARRHGISAESVWDLFVRNGNTSTHNLESGQSRESSTPSNVISSRILTSTPNMVNSKIKPEMDIVTGSAESSYTSSFYDTPTSSAMSNALLMGYHNQQQQLAAAGMAMNLASMFPTLPPSTSEIPPHSAGFTPSSSQSPAESQQHQNAEQALNLCVQKPALNDQFNHITGSLSPVSERPRSRSYSGSDIAKPLMVSVPSMTANCQDVGIQTKTCCKAGTESILYGMRSPSETSLQSGDSGANYQNVSNSGIDYSTESMASLLSSGRMFKCDHCESYFSEYAMYRIHAKLHVRGGRALPFVCPVCGEDCHDRVYFSLHVSEHLR